MDEYMKKYPTPEEFNKMLVDDQVKVWNDGIERGMLIERERVKDAREEERKRILALIDDRIQGYRTYKPCECWDDIIGELEQFKSIITDGE